MADGTKSALESRKAAEPLVSLEKYDTKLEKIYKKIMKLLSRHHDPGCLRVSHGLKEVRTAAFVGVPLMLLRASFRKSR